MPIAPGGARRCCRQPMGPHRPRTRCPPPVPGGSCTPGAGAPGPGAAGTAAPRAGGVRSRTGGSPRPRDRPRAPPGRPPARQGVGGATHGPPATTRGGRARCPGAPPIPVGGRVGGHRTTRPHPAGPLAGRHHDQGGAPRAGPTNDPPRDGDRGRPERTAPDHERMGRRRRHRREPHAPHEPHRARALCSRAL